MKSFLILFLALPTVLLAQKTETKQIILSTGDATGTSEVSRDTDIECIAKLPSEKELVATTDADNLMMWDVNGEEVKEVVQTWSATVTINYLVRKREVVVATQSGINPAPAKVDKDHLLEPRSVTITSNSDVGDAKAKVRGRTTHYFSSEETATADALKRAKAWLAQQKSLQCP